MTNYYGINVRELLDTNFGGGFVEFIHFSISNENGYIKDEYWQIIVRRFENFLQIKEPNIRVGKKKNERKLQIILFYDRIVKSIEFIDLSLFPALPPRLPHNLHLSQHRLQQATNLISDTIIDGEYTRFERLQKNGRRTLCSIL